MPLRFDTFFNPGASGGAGGPATPAGLYRIFNRSPLGHMNMLPQQHVPAMASGVTRDLVGAWVFSDGSSYVQNRAIVQSGKANGTWTATSGLAQGYSASEGGYVRCTGSGSERINLGSITQNDRLSFTRLGECTIMARVRYIPAAVSTFPRIIDKSNSGSGAGGWCFNIEESGNFFQFYNNSTAYSATPGTLSTLLGSKWATVGLRYAKNGAARTLEFFHSVQGASPTFFGSIAPATSFSTTTTNAAIGNWNHSTARNWEGDIAWVLVWDRGLSQTEVRRVIQNPSQLFTPFGTF